MRAEEKSSLLKKAKDCAAKYKNLSSKKKTQYIAIIILIAVILAIYFSSFLPSSSEGEGKEDLSLDTASTADYEAQLKASLETTLSKISGVGQVEVLITYESGKEIVPAMTTDTQKNSTTDTSGDGDKTSTSENSQSKITTIQSGNEVDALIIKEKLPAVKGVIVVAQGAGDVSVKVNLLKAVQTSLGVSPGQVEIFEMNEKQE